MDSALPRFTSRSQLRFCESEFILALIYDQSPTTVFSDFRYPYCDERICLFTGFYLSSTFLSVIEGSVNAILVNYATSPVEFHANHHVLSDEMRSVWKEFWLS